MSGWQSIETAPRDGSRIVCWALGWEQPEILMWKTNPRIEFVHEKGQWQEFSASYFGDPNEMGDYDYAYLKEGNAPTHWHPLEPLPQG